MRERQANPSLFHPGGGRICRLLSEIFTSKTSRGREGLKVVPDVARIAELIGMGGTSCHFVPGNLEMDILSFFAVLELPRMEVTYLT